MANKYYIILNVFLFLIIASCYYIYKSRAISSTDYWYDLNHDLHNTLRRSLRNTVDRLESNGVRTFLCGGTLLGSQRGGDIIPWDDDIDIGVYHKPDEFNILRNRIRQIYNDSGTSEYISDTSWGCKVLTSSHESFVDIFFFTDTDVNNGIVGLTNKKWRDKTKHWLHKDEILNLAIGTIDDDEYYVPSNTRDVVKRWYGDECLVNAKITHIHLLHQPLLDRIVTKIKLTYSGITM